MNHEVHVRLSIYTGCRLCPRIPLPSQEGGPAAEPTLAQEMSAQPTDGQLFEEGRRLQARADFKGAESRYRQAIAVALATHITFYLGTVLHATSRYGEARSLFEEAIRLKPDYAAPRIALENSYTT